MYHIDDYERAVTDASVLHRKKQANSVSTTEDHRLLSVCYRKPNEYDIDRQTTIAMCRVSGYVP